MEHQTPTEDLIADFNFKSEVQTPKIALKYIHTTYSELNNLDTCLLERRLATSTIDIFNAKRAHLNFSLPPLCTYTTYHIVTT